FTLCLLLSLPSFFFFYRAADLRDLHSFPTRRSSDLQTFLAVRDFLIALSQRQPVLLVLEDLHWADSLSMSLLSLLMERLSAQCRSEEHTSELQSRRDLVCRLLLEKKNINIRLRRQNT